MIDGVLYDNGNFGGGGAFGNGGGGSGIITALTPRALVGENVPTQQFDLSVISNLRPDQKFGRNLVRDIQEAYQTYISGSAVGRGGRYASDAAAKYGTTLTEAARGYLVAAGLPTLANVLPGNPTTPMPDTTGIDAVKKAQDALQKQFDEIQKGLASSPFKNLSDQLSTLFGGAVQNPPLQSQATGYTPVTTSSPIAGGATSNIGLYLVIGVVGVIAYFVYKRFKE